MKEILIQLVTAFLGALGFALLFGLHKRHLFFASLGGMITWGIYLLIHIFLQTPFLANLIASVFAVSFAEALAHWRKCPATLFVMPSIIPLVDHVYFTDAEGEHLIEAHGKYGFPYFGNIILDCINNTDFAIEPEKTLEAMRIAIEASNKALRREAL